MGQKIKDSKLGKWLGENAPKALSIVGELLPDSYGLGLVKNLISNSVGDPVKAAEGLKMVQDHELAMEQEMTKKNLAFQETERIQLQQEDLWTKRARPTRQYYWLVFITVSLPGMAIFTGEILQLPEYIWIAIFADFGFNTYKRSQDKQRLGLK